MSRAAILVMVLFFRLVTATFREAEVCLGQEGEGNQRVFSNRANKKSRSPNTQKGMAKAIRTFLYVHFSYEIKFINCLLSKKIGTNSACPNQTVETY